MYVALLFVVLSTGQAVQENQVTESLEECQKLQRTVVNQINKDKRVALYHFECVSADDLKKPGLDV